MNWFLKQLATPSTHNALAAGAAALVPLIPPPYGLIAVGIFGALGVLLPEAGENVAPMAVPMPAIKRALPLALLLGAAGYLTACTTEQTAQAQSAACVAQSVLNAAGASGLASGDQKLASNAAIASATLGALCTGLATDTPMIVTPEPVNPLPAKP